jgi:hypothetical protein
MKKTKSQKRHSFARKNGSFGKTLERNLLQFNSINFDGNNPRRLTPEIGWPAYDVPRF